MEILACVEQGVRVNYALAGALRSRNRQFSSRATKQRKDYPHHGI
jgi:hypothetical protein